MSTYTANFQGDQGLDRTWQYARVGAHELAFALQYSSQWINYSRNVLGSFFFLLAGAFFIILLGSPVCWWGVTGREGYRAQGQASPCERQDDHGMFRGMHDISQHPSRRLANGEISSQFPVYEDPAHRINSCDPRLDVPACIAEIPLGQHGDTAKQDPSRRREEIDLQSRLRCQNYLNMNTRIIACTTFWR